jgi:hypothetical protein
LTQEAEPVSLADLEMPTAARDTDVPTPRPDHATETAAVSLLPLEQEAYLGSLNGASGAQPASPESPGAEAG